MAKTLDINDLNISQAIAEIRYANAYEHWDNAGKLWRKLSDKWADLKYITVKPDQTSFILENKCELNVLLDRSSVIYHFPKKDLTDFYAVVEKSFGEIVTALNITEIIRLGFRIVFMKKFDNVEEASSFFFDYNLIHKPEKVMFGFESGNFVFPKYVIQQENDKLGVKIDIQVDTLKIELTPPLIALDEFEPMKKDLHRIHIDIDYHTKTKILLSQLNFITWIKEAFTAIKRDFPKFIS